MKKIVWGLLIILILCMISLYGYLRSFIPDYSAEISAPGLHDTVIVERNRYAVPTITAKHDDDLYFAWGYVNAQDRMFQMEFTRRVAQGRISESAGESTLQKDIFLRAVGFYDIAKREAEMLPPDIKRSMQRYVDGINYYLDTNGTPLYMKLMGLEKEKWAIADATVVAMMLNWSLAYNMKHELLYHKIAGKIDRDRCIELLNLVPPETPTIVEDRVGSLVGDREFVTTIQELDWLLGCRSASNNWAVSSDKTAHNGTLLATDMQVHSSKLPNDFYLIHVKSGDFEVAGAQVAGLPVIFSGYNRHIAWGLTNNGADMVDLFIETIDWDTKTYFYKGKAHPLKSKVEEFVIKGKDPVRKTIYYAGRRPLLNEVFTDLGVVISLDWTGFDRIQMEGSFLLNRARDYEEFVAGAKKIRISPQNIVYADDKGNIAYRVIGSLPVRRGGTGNLPPSGERVESNWSGNIPDTAYPSLKNPERGYIITSNNKVLKDYPYYLNAVYAPRYRYENIAVMLKDKKSIDVEYVKEMQTDTHTILARKVIPIITRYVEAGEDEQMKKAYNIILKWDGHVTTDSVASSLYNTFLVRFMYQTLADEIGEDLAAEYINERYISQERFFYLLEKKSDFFDDTKTPERESISDIATRAFKESIRMLEEYTGSSDPESWEWGEIHQIKFDHILGKSAILRPFVNYGPFPFAGDGETNNRARFYDISFPFIANLASAPRIIVKFDPDPKGYMMLITGENEYFMSRHNTDMTDAWMRHEYFCLEEEETRYTSVFKPERE